MFGRTKKTNDGEGKTYKTVLLQGDRWWQVQGTFAHKGEVAKAKRRYRGGMTVGVLVPVTEGKYTGAVSVCVNGTQLGSMPSEASADFYPVVLALQKERKRATCLLDFRDGDFGDPALWVEVCAEPVLAD